MTSTRTTPRAPWWQRRTPSFLVFCVVILAMVLVSMLLWSQISGILPDVGKNEQGDDPWLDPIGVEKVGPFQVAHIPDCAAAPVVRIGLWDEKSNPYWEVSGPPTPMASFAVGALPEGFTEDTPYKKPPAGSTLRLVVVRKVKGVAGVRYKVADLRTGYVATGVPIKRYLLDDFQTGSVCGNNASTDGKGDGGSGSSDDQSVPGVGGG
ncbi:MAG: hypothetical protein U0P45_12835 [Acidimicrobiales bacterium]